MDETMISTADAERGGRTSRRRLMAGAGIVALAAAAVATQRHAFAQPMGGHHGPGGPGGPGGFGPGMDFGMGLGFGGMGETDPAIAARRLDAMVAFRLADVDATPEQRSRISTIVQSLARDLHGTRAKLRELRGQSVALLGAAKVDRAALEKLRAEQIQIADASSRRLLQAVADGADVLTPEQRTRLMERHQRHQHGRAGAGREGRGVRDGQSSQGGRSATTQDAPR